MDVAQPFDQVAGGGVDKGARYGGEAGKQGELGGGKGGIGFARHVGYKGGGTQSDADGFRADNAREHHLFGQGDGVKSAEAGQPDKSQNGHDLYDAEEPQCFVDAEFQHPDAAEYAGDDGGPETCVFGNQADVGFAETHVEIKRGGQRGGHAVAEFVQEDEQQHQGGLFRAFTREKFLKRFNHGLNQRARCGGRQVGFFGEKQRHQQAGQHEEGGNDEDVAPRHPVGQNQAQRAGDEGGDAVGVDVDGVA